MGPSRFVSLVKMGDIRSPTRQSPHEKYFYFSEKEKISSAN
jgi:hypothetical protein